MNRASTHPRRGFIQRKVLVGFTLLLIFGSFSVWRQSVYIQNMAPYRPYLSNSLIPAEESAQWVKRMALGYDNLVCARIWLRTIQDFGGQFRDPFALEAMSNAFFAMAVLQPLFTESYDFGSLVIADEGSVVGSWISRTPEYGDVEAGFRMLETVDQAREKADMMLDTAMRLFEYGMSHDQDHYRHPYNATYAAITGYNDPMMGVPYAEVANSRYDCPTWVLSTIAYLHGRGGQYRVAISRWFAQMRDAITNQDATQMSIALRKISEDGVPLWNEEVLDKALALRMAFNDGELPDSVGQLEDEGYLTFHPDDVLESIALWREAHGVTEEMPADLNTLVAEGHFPADPEDSPEPLLFFDYPRFLNDADMLMETAQPHVEIPEELFRLDNYLTHIGEPMAPVSLWSIHSEDSVKIHRQQQVGVFHYEIDRVQHRVRDTAKMYRQVARELYDIRHRLDTFETENGVWPASLEMLFEWQEAEMPLEPATGQPYGYDPETGIAHSIRYSTEELIFQPGQRVGIDVLGSPDDLV